uniref:Uncharacterized protein n=1 Tax=Siphoviridae sp. ctwrX9 TaxID=2825735 RepID=A0A8S5PTG1_9CAUD|nr:MAG TPA: hypothetical protein [Siphoviridae sp. ctwrX9]
MAEIVLGDNEIESLINGESIQKTLPDGKTLLIRQSYVKDMAAPIISHDKKVYSDSDIKNIKIASSMTADTFRLGY